MRGLSKATQPEMLMHASIQYPCSKEKQNAREDNNFQCNKESIFLQFRITNDPGDRKLDLWQAYWKENFKP